MAGLIQIDSRNVKGENGTGFEKRSDLGEQCCGNCEYFRLNQGSQEREKYSRSGSCGQEDMMKVSKEPKDKDGRVKVQDGDCCEYVHRAGRKEYGSSRRMLSSPIRR